MPEPDNLLVQRPRRRWRWKILLVLVLLVVGGVTGVIWWALSTNQTGNAISHLFAQRLPGRLEIDRTEFNGLSGMVLSGVRLLEKAGDAPAVTVDRIVVSGELWRGKVELISVEGCQLHATIASVHFLHRLIKAENAIPPGPNPSLIKLHFTGGVKVNGETAIDGAQVDVAATGPMVEVTGTAKYAGAPVAVQVSTVESGDQRTYRITLNEGRLPVWRSCDWLADLTLLPRLPADARAWVPEHANLASTVVIADKAWEHFTGDAKASWDNGRGQGDLQIDRRFIKITRMLIRDDGLGSLDGQAVIDTDANTVAVSATTWAPGPRIRIPAIVPTASILKAMPRAQFDGTLNRGVWDVKLGIAGTGQASMTWTEGQPLRIAAKGVSLPLLQPFLPAELTLASGNATSLTAEVGANGLVVASATVEQARALWQGWALGSLDGRVALRPVADGVDLDLTFPALGKAAWRAGPSGGRIKLELSSCEALMARLKGPQVLPELSGATALEAQVRWRDDVLLADIAKLRLDGVGITDVLRTLRLRHRRRVRAGC